MTASTSLTSAEATARASAAAFVGDTWAWQYRILPLSVTASALRVGRAQPLSEDELDELKRHFRKEIHVDVMPDRAVVEGLREAFAAAAGASENSMEALFDALVERALDEHAGDLHFQWIGHGDDRQGEVLMRVDRALYPIQSLPRADFEKLLRVAASSVSAALQDPLDTKTKVFKTRSGRKTTLRYQAMPDYRHGVATIRLIGSSGKRFTLSDLHLIAQVEDALRILLKRPGGMVLTLGPPHSGKTTLLWTLANEITERARQHNRRVKVLSAEDSVEVPQDSAVQVEISDEREVSYPRFLVGANRSDTDISIIGEISDELSCRNSMQLALSVRYCFASLHARDPYSAILRLLEWGITPAILMSALRALVVQRLLPLLCQKCRKQTVASPYARRFVSASLKTVQQERFLGVYEEGRDETCGVCHGKGRYGSVAIVEVVPTSAALLSVVCNPNSSYGEIEDAFAAARRAASGDGRGKNMTLAVQAAALFLEGMIGEDAMFEAELGGDWERIENESA